MSKQDKINQILFFAKGKEFNKPYGRRFTVENGILTLISEIEISGNPEPVSFITKFDDLPINEFNSKVSNPIFKPTTQFLIELSIMFTDSFKQNYLNNKSDQVKNESTDIIYSIAKNCKQTFASREEDVDMTPWKSNQ